MDLAVQIVLALVAVMTFLFLIRKFLKEKISKCYKKIKDCIANIKFKQVSRKLKKDDVIKLKKAVIALCGTIDFICGQQHLSGHYTTKVTKEIRKLFED